MATRNNRDVTMTLSVETLGEDNVKKLQQSVLQLAKEGGDAAPEFQRLADEIERIGTQGAALQAFRQLSDSTEELRDKQLATATSAEKLATDLETLRAATDRAKQEQRDATRALIDGRTANVEAGNAIQLLKVEYDAAGKNTQEYRDRLKALTAQQGEARAQLVELTQASKEANRAASQAEAEQARVEKQYERTSKAAESLGKSLREQERALEESAVAARELGVATDDIASAELGLLQALNRAGQAAVSRADSIREMTEADRLLAIEEQRLAELMARGQTALEQEVAAQRDAAASIKAYAEAKEQAARDAETWQREADAIVDAAEAARKLRDETERLTEAQRELKAQRAFEEQAEAARRMAASAEYIRFWSDALDEVDRKAEEATAATNRLDAAFDSIGIRQAQELTQEIARIRTAMQTVADSGQLTGTQLKIAFEAGERQVRELERELRALNGTLTIADRAADVLKNSMGQIAAGNLVADGIASIIERVKEMGRQFIEVTVRTERLQRSLQAIYKDTEVAQQQFDVLRDAAGKAGVSVNSITDSFVRFSASAKAAGIDVGVTNELFQNLTMAGASLGLTSDSVSGALDALAQMASKGVVSMEELRQQLGDRLPGALGLSAKGLGITEQQLIKLVETGRLTTDQFFPAFSRALTQMHGDTNTLAGNWARLMNLLTGFTQATAAAGGIDVLRGALTALGVVLGAILIPLHGFIETLGLTGQAIGRFVAGLASGEMRLAFEGFGGEIEKSGARLRSLQTGIDNFVNKTDQQSTSVNAATTALQGEAAALLKTAAAQESATSAVTASGNAYVQSLVKMSENTSAIEASVVASEKLAKAKQTEGTAMVEIARLTGDANKELLASVAAAEANAAAAATVVATRQREVDSILASIEVIQAEGERRGGLTSAMQLQIGALNETLEKKSAELEASAQTQAQLEAQAAASVTLAKAYENNSSQIDAYRGRMESLSATAESVRATIAAQETQLATLKQQVEAGTATQLQYEQALRAVEQTKREYIGVLREAASAEALYRDAVADAVTGLDRKTQAETASLELSKATLTVAEHKWQAMAKEAKESGNLMQQIYAERKAREAKIEIMELELQIDRLQIDAKAKALEIQIAAIQGHDAEAQAQREKLAIEQQLLAVQRELLGVQEQAIAQAKEEANAIGYSTSARHGSVAAIRSETRARRENADAIRAETAAMQEQKASRTSDGFDTNKDGSAKGTFNNTLPVDQAFKMVEKLNKGQITGADLAAAEAGFKQASDALQWLQAQKPGSVSLSAWSSTEGLYAGARQALDAAQAAAMLEERRAKPGGGSSSYGGSTSSYGTGGGTTSSPSKTIVVNINGKATSVNVASDADAQQLSAILREIENQANSAT